ncbi:MAG: trypsin-like serine protease [Deltaproteobacteria bacterium]|nr:trypsin-like serine protease [Deltaproteobacteria bacterium]
MRPLHVLACCALAAACGDLDDVQLTATPDGRLSAIIGGAPSEVDDYRPVGVLLIVGQDPWNGGAFASMMCSGTLIAPDTVLLAAHCIDDETLSWFGSDYTLYFSFSLDVASFGQTTLDLPPETYTVASVVECPGFDIWAMDGSVPGPGDYKDLGIVFLAQAVLDRAPAMVMGPNDSAALQVGAEVAIVGYGQRSPEASFDPQDVGVKYQAMSIINELGVSEMQIGNVAPTPQKCHGDSGGPTFLTYIDGYSPADRLIGVTSHAYDESDCYKGGVDTRIDAYRDWIDSTLTSACSQGQRVACENGGGLAVPALAPAGSSSGSYYRRRRTPDSGCAGAGGAGLAPAVAVLALLCTARRRRRSA